MGPEAGEIAGGGDFPPPSNASFLDITLESDLSSSSPLDDHHQLLKTSTL